jgi:outer membrane protein assembly factor BamB
LQPRQSRQLSSHGIVQASTVFNPNGTAFVADMSGTVQAFSPAGDLLWRQKLVGGISATPAVLPEEPALFVGTHAGAVYRLDSRTGQVKWRKDVPSRTDPRILSDLLFLESPRLLVLSSWGARFVALDAASGEEKVSWDAGLHARSAAAADTRDNLYALRAVRGRGVQFVQLSRDGEERVLFTEPEDERGVNRALVAAPPVLNESRATAYLVINRTGGGHLVAWSLSSNKEMWRAKLPAQVEAAPTVLKDGTVILADLAGAVRSFASDGNQLWTYETDSEYLLAGGIADGVGTFIVGDPLGQVHHLQTGGLGKVICELQRSIQARPSFSPKGELYVPSSEKAVHILAPRT